MDHSDVPVLPAAPAIEALEWLAALRRLRIEFKSSFGFEPDNLSHWNPKPQFHHDLEGLIAPPCWSLSPTDYVYSYDLALHRNVLAKLNEPSDRSCLFTPAGTTSIANTVTYLKNAGVKKIAAIRPYYFVLEEFLSFCGISLVPLDVHRDSSGAYRLPPPELALEAGCDAAWLTTPVYGTSVYFQDKEIQAWLSRLTAAQLVIAVDESLAHVDRAVIPKAAEHDRLIGIYVPHKALSLNGFRFSVITFPSHLQTSFDQWSDLFSGGLPNDSLAALKHFCSAAYPDAVRAARDQQEKQFLRFRQLVASFPSVELDPEGDGHFRHVYLPDLNADFQKDMDVIRELIFATGTSFIPAARFGFPGHSGFCFRVNLLRLDDAGMGGLYRLLKELERLLDRS